MGKTRNIIKCAGDTFELFFSFYSLSCCIFSVYRLKKKKKMLATVKLKDNKTAVVKQC